MTVFLASAFVKILTKSLQRLPFSLVWKIGAWAGHFAWVLDTSHRRLALRNQRFALGPNAPTVVRATFARVTQNLLSAGWMAGRTDAELERWISVEGVQENLLPAVARRKGVILVLFHLGNWEALARVVSRIPGIKFSTIYQPLKNQVLDNLVATWRQRSGVRLINRHHGFVDAVTRLRGGEAVGMLVDQHAGDHGIWIPFFGRLASTTPLPSLLARRTGASIVPLFVHTQPNALPRWKVEFSSPIEVHGRTDGEIMAELHSRLEAEILRDPSDWFWLHDRWKTPSPNFLLKSYRRGVHVPPGVKLKPFRILVRSANWLGDAVLSLPALQAIKSGRPDAHVTLLTPAKLADLWKGQSCVDRVAVSTKELRDVDFDAAILFPNSFRSAWEAWRLKIPRRQGYAGHRRSKLLTARCPETLRSGFHEHEVKDFFALARWSGAEIFNEVPRMDPLPPMDPTFSKRGSFVALHPGAAHGSAKRWLPERFVELVYRLPNIHWKIIGSSDEIERNAGLVREMGNHAEDWTGLLPLSRLTSLLSQADALVGNDSGPMHLAAAVGTPVVALFGSTEPRHTGPLGSGHRILRHPVDCSPCYLKECPIDLRCMKGIEVDQVIEALQDVLKATKTSSD